VDTSLSRIAGAIEALAGKNQPKLYFGAVVMTTGMHWERPHAMAESEASPEADPTHSRFLQAETAPDHRVPAHSVSKSSKTKTDSRIKVHRVEN
jgi:hypothetical protein